MGLASTAIDSQEALRAAAAGPIAPGPNFLRQVALGLALGVFFGAMQVSVAAYAVGRGTPDAAALLYFASNCTNLVGGWVYGAWRYGGSPRRRQAAAAACLTLAGLPLTFLDVPLAVGAILALTGLAVPDCVGGKRQRVMVSSGNA
ncbi:hypothetical protein GCM10023080_087370 [Streptomyces pseudoechinosporeus]